MKKNVLRKDFFMEIRKTAGRFISIFFIVLLGVAFYSGIRATEPDMRLSGDAFFDRMNLMDIKVIGTLGLTDDDVKAIEKLDGVEKAAGTYSKDVLCPVENTEKVVHMLAYQEEFNEVEVSEGRLPEKENECLLDEDFFKKYGYEIGDEITFRSGDGEDLTDTLVTDTYKIVGIGSSPLYIALSRGTSQIGNGEVNAFAIVDDSAFQMDVYTEINIAVSGAKDAIVFTEEYETLIDDVIAELEGIEEERGIIRRNDILAEAEDELAKAEETVLEEEGKLDDAKEELKAAKSSTAKQLVEAQKKLIQGEKELKAAQQKIDDGERQLDAAKEQLIGKEAELEAGKAEYKAGVAELEEKEEQFERMEKVYQASYDIVMEQFTASEERFAELKNRLLEQQAEQQTQLEEIQVQIDELEGKSELTEIEAVLLEALRTEKSALETNLEITKESLAGVEKGEAALLEVKEKFLAAGEEIADGRAQIDAAWQQLNDAKAQIDAGEKQIEEAWGTISAEEKKLLEGKAQLRDGQDELREGHLEYESGAVTALQEFISGEEQIAEGEAQIISAKQDIADAKAELAKFENPKWYIQDRVEAVSEYEGYGDNAERIGAIGKVFPVLFFLVAALISLTSMTRMVEEQRVQIGTLKALGYEKGVIAKKYIFYALLATLGGSISGVLIGEKLIPVIIVVAYKILYIHLPDVVLPYNLYHGVIATVIAVGCVLAATVFACYKELLAQPAQLMRPPAPKIGKKTFLERIPWLWKRFNFTWKSSIRNLLRYKKRFFMTVFGISGSMGLMLVGFGLKDSIYDIGTIQYEEIQFYDAAVFADDSGYKEDQSEILSYMKEQNDLEAFMQCRMQKIDVRADGGVQSLYLVVPEGDAEVGEFFDFHSRTTDDVYSLEDDQVILTEKVASLLNVDVGDTVLIQDEEKGDKEVEIQAICENYMGHYLYMSEELYEELYGAIPRYNCIMYRVQSGQEKKISVIGEKLLSYDSVLNVTYTDATKETLDGMLGTLNLVTIVLIVSAGMLAFVVLYNLNTINIAERKRELATLKVLGFYDGEVSSYVYRENIILTFIGILFGFIIGNLLHRFIIVTVEVNAAMFGRVIHPRSYVYGALWTIAFSMLINWIMHFKLKKIDMVESLKSVE